MTDETKPEESMRHWDDDLAAYEATFADDPPIADKLADLDALAVPPVRSRTGWWWVAAVVAGVGYAILARCVLS